MSNPHNITPLKQGDKNRYASLRFDSDSEAGSNNEAEPANRNDTDLTLQDVLTEDFRNNRVAQTIVNRHEQEQDDDLGHDERQELAQGHAHVDGRRRVEERRRRVREGDVERGPSRLMAPKAP